jgi:hypothetical protein
MNMAATIQIHEMTTDATTGVDKTSGTVRFKAVASTTSTAVDASNPLVVPGAGTDYSYVKKLRPYMEAPPDTNITNLRWYSDGSNGFGTGIGVTAKNIGTTFGTHYDTEMSAGADLFSYTSGSPLDGDATDTSPFVPADDNSYVGDIIELQMSVASTATNGTLSAETLTFAYDEV